VTVPFVILSTIRCGSTHLTRLLNEHPSVVCNGEIFNHEDPDHSWATVPGSTAEMIQMAFIDHPGRDKKASVSAVGCKVDDISLFRERTRLAELLAVPGMRCIVLQRRNQFESLRSMLQAWETSNWQHQAGEEYVPPPPVTISPVRAMAFFERSEWFYGKISGLIPPEQRLWIDYDELVTKQDQVLAQVWQFLGVTPHGPLTSTLERQESRPLRETVTNYGELQLLFEYTEYAGFLP
jgi:hypothetical protein